MTTAAPESRRRTWQDLPAHPPTGDPHAPSPPPPGATGPGPDPDPDPSPVARRAAIIASLAVIAAAFIAGGLYFAFGRSDAPGESGAQIAPDPTTADAADGDGFSEFGPDGGATETPRGLDELFPDGLGLDELFPEGFGLDDLDPESLLDDFFSGERNPFSEGFDLGDDVTPEELLELLPDGLLESFGITEEQALEWLDQLLGSN